jgi:hypothetical protein
MSNLSKQELEIYQNLLKENNLRESGYVYRYTSEKHLEKDDQGNYYLKTKDEPTDMIIDPYRGHNHAFIAREIGPGLSFLSKKEREYERHDRVCVKVTIAELMEQGGLIYKVTSLPAYIKPFFFTLPEGRVRVEMA